MPAHRFCVAILLMAITGQLTFAQNPLPTNQSPDAGEQSCHGRSMSESESRECFDKAYRDAEVRLNAAYSQAVERLSKALAWAKLSKNPEKIASHQPLWTSFAPPRPPGQPIEGLIATLWPTNPERPL